jgi:hypothetical protein
MSVKSKSNAVPEGKEPLFSRARAEIASAHVATDTVDATQILTSTEGQRTEQMYELADIFAAIFEALPEEYEDAIVTRREAA